MMKKVLITGGSGLVGSALSEKLQKNGYEVVWLGRSAKVGKFKTFAWDYTNNYVDPKAFEGITHLVHLAGAGIADKRWTSSRKKEILESRSLGTSCLIENLKAQNVQLQSFVGASAIGYYGPSGDQLLEETSPAGNDFMAEVCKAWEAAYQDASKVSSFFSMVRIGIVLSKEGGALPKLQMPFKFFAGAALGNGKQWMSWIHISDLVDQIIFQLEGKAPQGIYNAVAPLPVTNIVFTNEIGRILGRPVWMPNVPAFLLKIALGEMSATVLGSQKVVNNKIQETGFRFQYGNLGAALTHLIEKGKKI